MSLADYLEKIQNKPRPVRVAIMWVGVAIFMTFFLILWAATLNSGQNNENLASENQFKQEAQSFSEIKSEIPSLWQSLKASISGLFESVNGTGQNEPKIQIEGGAQPSSQSAVPPSHLP
jgi:hypothetical protein